MRPRVGPMTRHACGRLCAARSDFPPRRRRRPSQQHFAAAYWEHTRAPLSCAAAVDPARALARRQLLRRPPMQSPHAVEEDLAPPLANTL